MKIACNKITWIVLFSTERNSMNSVSIMKGGQIVSAKMVKAKGYYKFYLWLRRSLAFSFLGKPVVHFVRVLNDSDTIELILQIGFKMVCQHFHFSIQRFSISNCKVNNLLKDERLNCNSLSISQTIIACLYYNALPVPSYLILNFKFA